MLYPRVLQRTRQEMQMRWNEVDGNWRQYRGKVRKQWDRLTDQHIAQINGKRAGLVRKIQEVYRVSQEEARSVRWTNGNGRSSE